MRDKRQKFIELAEKRVSRLIKDVRLVGNLSNRSNYVYRDDDVRKIFAAIETELRAARKRFDGTGSSDEVVFKLK
jgi:hypothetical protein